MRASSTPTLWWTRRDLRLADNPALQAAVEQGSEVLPLFVLDPVLLRSAGRGRRAWLMAALQALDADLRVARSEEHTSELQSRQYLVCGLLLDKPKDRMPSTA